MVGNSSSRPVKFFQEPSDILLEIRIRFLMQKSIERGVLLRTAMVSMPYNKGGQQRLMVPLGVYESSRKYAPERLLALEKIRRVDKFQDQLGLFNVSFSQQMDSMMFAVCMMEWASRNQITIGNKYDLLDEFFIKGANFPSVPGFMKKTYVNKLKIVGAPEDYLQIVFDLQGELDRKRLIFDLISAVAPRAALVAVGFFPAAGPVIAGLTIEALIGLAGFFLFLADAEADGDITEEEAEEAWWELVGLAPFSIIGHALLAKEIIGSGAVVFERLMEALAKLPGLLEEWSIALENGWNSYVKYDPASTIFLPEFAVRALNPE